MKKLVNNHIIISFFISSLILIVLAVLNIVILVDLEQHLNTVCVIVGAVISVIINKFVKEYADKTMIGQKDSNFSIENKRKLILNPKIQNNLKEINKIQDKQ